jgi:uncharacterized protein
MRRLSPGNLLRSLTRETRNESSPTMIPEQKLLSEITRRIVATAHPLRIIIFGSATRGGMDQNSDLDLLVIMPEGVHRRRTAQAIYLSLAGLGIAKDIVVATLSDIQNYGKNQSLILYPALREGKELYRAAG